MKSKFKNAVKSLISIDQTLKELVEMVRAIRHDVRVMPIEMRLERAMLGRKDRAATNPVRKKKAPPKRG
jgi:hypothetical protein